MPENSVSHLSQPLGPSPPSVAPASLGLLILQSTIHTELTFSTSTYGDRLEVANWRPADITERHADPERPRPRAGPRLRLRLRPPTPARLAPLRHGPGRRPGQDADVRRTQGRGPHIP